MKKITQIKFVKKIELQLCDKEVPKEENYLNLNYFTCKLCHWQFYGDMVRFGHGHSTECKQIPNFCPGCGIKIEFSKNEKVFTVLGVNKSSNGMYSLII
jgi:rubrerythrin